MSVFESKEALRVRFPLDTRVVWKDDQGEGDGLGDWPGIVTGHADGTVVIKLDVGGTFSVVPDQLQKL